MSYDMNTINPHMILHIHTHTVHTPIFYTNKADNEYYNIVLDILVGGRISKTISLKALKT